MISEIKSYFKQQAEIYGDNFYLDLEGPAVKEVQTKPSKTATLAELHSEIKDCQKCGLADSRTQVVFGNGPENASLMCVGEAPGLQEDKQGLPFVGAAGELLTKILGAIKFSRDEVYIANIIKCRPPENRNPEESEIEECLPFLKQQIEMIKPSVILALGRVAAHSLLGTNESISNLRLKNNKLGDIPVFVTYHPAALLRNTELKRPVWEDVQQLRKVYDTLPK